MSLKKQKQNRNISLEIDGIVESDPETISNEFNTFFTTEPVRITKRIYQTEASYTNFMGPSNQKSFFLAPVTSDEIKETILKLNINKSNGPHSIPSQILKIVINEISDILASIFNMSWVIIDRFLCYLTSIKFLKRFLDDNKLILKRQFGFRSKHSTKDSLITITETVREAFDKGDLTCGVFLDFQKAFDTVNHNILLNKLKSYGFRGISKKWLASYLTRRKQFVSCNGIESILKEVEQEVSQGSVLGPLLFLIYINHISNALIYSKAFIFADDTSLLYSPKNPRKVKKHINVDLKKLLKWLKANKIFLNVKKTETILFKTTNRKLNYDLKIKLDGKRLSLSSSTKYLGVIINENLSWSKHVELLASKLRRTNGTLSNLRHFVTKDMIRSIYFALFHSHLVYSLEVWGQNLPKNSRIEKLQKSAVRIITFSDQNSHSKPIFYQTKHTNFV